MIHPIAHPARRVHHELVDQVKLMHFSYDLVGVRLLITFVNKTRNCGQKDDPSNNQSI